MLEDQLLHCAAKGLGVIVTLSNGDEIVGWLGGIDDYHILVLTMGADKKLVHKAAPAITLDVHVVNEPSGSVRSIVDSFRERARSHLADAARQNGQPEKVRS